MKHIKAALIGLFALFAFTTGARGQGTIKPATAPIVTHKTSNGKLYQVFQDSSLALSKQGNLLRGTLAKDYLVEQAMDMRPIIPMQCNGRIHQVSRPYLFAKKGTLINFYRDQWCGNSVSGTIQTITLATANKVPVWGFPDGVLLPANSVLLFQVRNYTSEKGCGDIPGIDPNDCASYWIIKCGAAILGADASLPGLGKVKKGEMILFQTKYRERPSDKNPPDDASKWLYDGEIVLVSPSDREYIISYKLWYRNE
jgi:hypothetical protein